MPINNTRVDAVLDELALLQQQFIQASGKLLDAVEDDFSSSSFYLEELNVTPSDIKEMKALTNGGELLPSLMSPKRKFVLGIKQAIATSENTQQLRDAVRKIGGTKYNISRAPL